MVGLHKIRLMTNCRLNIVKKPTLLRLIFRLERSTKGMKNVFSLKIPVISVVVYRYRRI